MVYAPRVASAGAASRHVGQARATVEIEGTSDPRFRAAIDRWLDKSTEAIVTYYGRFPVPELYIHVIATAGKGVRGGQTFPGDIPLIRLRVGEESNDNDLLHRDWVLVHEMVHLAFPWMNLRNNWMAEGLAVYVESVARVQAGHLTPGQIWRDFMTMMPKGLPRQGEGGFDVTVNWGRTYWGGAVFCLTADIAIRQETANAKGLQHALRAINAVRDFRREWDFTETLAIGDAATGTTVLMDQYNSMRIDPVSSPLDQIWPALGIGLDGGVIRFDDTAPLAAIRRAIETRPV
jgi:hypothetical protein